MPEHTIDPSREKKAQEYAKKNRQLFIVEALAGLIFLLVLLLSGLSNTLSDLLKIPYSAQIALYYIIIMSSYLIITIPLTVYSDLILPRQYGLSHQSWKSWLADKTKEYVLGLLVTTGLITAIYQCMQSFQQIWWLVSSAFMIIFIILLSWIAPVLILPLFFKLEPLTDTNLRNRLLELAKRCQINVKDVFLIKLSSKTVAGNAMVMGWGATRRIALGDTLLDKYTPEEIEVVMAHELGHQKHWDIVKVIALQSLITLITFYIVYVVINWAVPLLNIKNVHNAAAIPLFILSLGVITLLLSPLVKAYTRYIEEAADRYALSVTENPGAFASMLTKLTDQNLLEPNPSKWTEYLFYDHPPYYKRLALATSYEKRKIP